MISAASSTNPIIEQIRKCNKTEGASKLAGLVADLYYNKMTLDVFVEKFLKWRTDMTADTLAKCFPDGLVELKNDNSILNKLGLTVLLATNCEKDVGAALLLLDQVVTSFENIKTEWKTALLSTVMFGLLGRQTVSDCENSINQIINVWRN